MSSAQRKDSNTLPRSFTFHYDDQILQTPMTLPNITTRPSSPPRLQQQQQQPYRLRRTRPRPNPRPNNRSNISINMPIPTIEISDPEMSLQPSVSSSVLHSRSPPPRTPSAQIMFENPTTESAEDEIQSQGESISRPSTACSGFSDSSVSSSIESFSSVSGSFTSPESDGSDKKDDSSSKTIRPGLPIQSLLETPVNHNTLGQTKPAFTEEMDSHLWKTYMCYLQDPRHTPWRMLPGAPPPLGVCSRVIREAKKTWKASRNKQTQQAQQTHSHFSTDSPDTLRVNSGQSTPTNTALPKHNMHWPRSDSACRKRLRELCKKNPSLSTHYTRLISAGSPSPFLSTMKYNRIHPHEPSKDSFATRDFGISLLASTSEAVSTLNQLTEESQTLDQVPDIAIQASTRRRPNVIHHKSHSLHIEPRSMRTINSILASPFQPRPKLRAETQASEFESMPKLASPIELHAPIPQSNSNSIRFGRRRGESLLGALMGLEDDDNDELDKNFSQPVIPGISTRRVRQRGFSLNDVNETSRRLSRISGPPAHTIGPIRTHFLHSWNNPSINNDSHSNSTLLPPFNPHGMRRLGSPFSEKPTFHTFPRVFSHNGLEPTIETQEEKVGGVLETNSDASNTSNSH